MFLSPRSCTVATQRRRYHVVPSGMFQPFIPSESADLLQSQFSVFATVVREFVEELYGVEELETGDGRVDPQAIYRRREARLLSDMLEHGSAALLYTGVGVNLLALRHEICTVLVIDDPGWYERECGELRICDEYLQQCQQTDLLPDQRWVRVAESGVAASRRSDVSSATAASENRRSVPRDRRKEHHDGRGAQDDRCPARRQAAGQLSTLMCCARAWRGWSPS